MWRTIISYIDPSHCLENATSSLAVINISKCELHLKFRAINSRLINCPQYLAIIQTYFPIAVTNNIFTLQYFH